MVLVHLLLFTKCQRIVGHIGTNVVCTVDLMTGVALRLQNRDEYDNSIECCHAIEEPYKVLF